MLQEVGVDSSKYSGHSFRIGAATTAAKLGVSDSLIMILGRWRSSAFVRYIWTPWEQLSQVSSLLSGDGVMEAIECSVTCPLLRPFVYVYDIHDFCVNHVLIYCRLMVTCYK